MPFLEHPQGKPTFNLLKMAREGLAFELRNALHKAKISKEAVTKENIPARIENKQSLISFQVIPLTDTVEQHFLIVFEEKILPDVELQSDTKNTQNEDAKKRYEQLEKELSQTREDMRSITEDMEAANEELQSSNEEMQSSNEEMQSLNEELETSKEELQSTNEELTIVNQEMLDKQEQLNAARFYAESIIAALREPLVILNKSFRIITANASFYKKFNTDEQEVEGKLFYEIQNHQWDDDTIRLLLEKILPKKEKLTDFEIILDFPKIGKRHLLMNASQVVNEKTTEQLILLAIEDVTDKVHSKKQIESNALLIQNIYMNAPASICTFKGPKHIYELVNPAYQKLFDKRHLVGKPLLEALPELEGQGVDKILDNVYNTGEIFKSTEIPVMLAREDNLEPEQRYFNTTMQPIFNEEHKIIGVVNFGYDVTEQIMARKQIEESVALAEAATQIAENAVIAKQQFLSNMSHEIRTPMNAIIGFTKVLSKTELTEKQKEYLQAIKIGGDALIVLINDILDLAKVDAGKMTFAQMPFKMASSISAMLHLFETKIEEKNIKLVKEYDDKIPEVLLGDSVRLHQIILNLVSNAVKFTSKGKITVCVNLLNQDEEKVTLEFAVTDTGIGIAENSLKNIFDDFQQAYTDTTRAYGGTGLGLSIVKQLVEKQGGTIEVKSKIGEGSTFSFTLSFQKTNDEVVLENVAEQYQTETKSFRVLVVEDIKLNQLLMRTILDDFKFECDIVDNGKIAIEKLQTNTYDIILMDLQMPEMNGFEATEHIRNKMNLQTPIIALTADVTTVDVEKCKAVGMNDYISKPIDEKLLYNKILDLMKLK